MDFQYSEFLFSCILSDHSSHEWHRTFSRPLTIPVTPHSEISQFYKHLNDLLLVWGYQEDPSAILPTLQAEFVLHAKSPPGESHRERWIWEKQDWVMQADSILDEIEEFISGEIVGRLSGEILRYVWQTLSVVAYKIQYMIAAVECRIDML